MPKSWSSLTPKGQGLSKDTKATLAALGVLIGALLLGTVIVVLFGWPGLVIAFVCAALLFSVGTVLVLLFTLLRDFFEDRF